MFCKRLHPFCHFYSFAALALLLCTIPLPQVYAQTPTPAGPASPPPAEKIVHITVVGNSLIATADVIQRLEQKPGGALDSKENTSKENGSKEADGLVNLAAVRGMGVFNSVQVTTTPDPAGGTDVTCTVVENPIVRVIKFTANTPNGNPSVPPATLTGQMQTSVDHILNTNTLVHDLDILFNHDTGYMRMQGYQCDVSSDINIDPKNGILTIPLIEAHVEKVELQGDSPILEPDLLAAIQAKPGDVLNFLVINQELSRFVSTHRFADVQSQFTQSQVGKIKVTVTVRVPRLPFGTILPHPAGSVTIPYAGAVGGLVMVPIRVNDQKVGHFVLGTNIELSVLSTAFAATLGLTPQPMREGGQPYFVAGQPASSVPLDRITLGGKGGVTVQELSLPVTDLAALSKQAGQTIDGILGADLLSRMAIGFDFPRRQITFWDHGNLSLAERITAGFGSETGMLMTPLGGNSPLPAVTAQIQNAAVVKSTLMFIASANQTSLLPPSAAATLGMTPLTDPSTPGTVFSRAGHVQLTGSGTARLHSPELSHTTELSLTAPLFQLSDQTADSTLGMNILCQYRVLLDGPAHTAFFRPEVSITGPSHRTSWQIPFLFDELTTPNPVVRVSINGHPPMLFMLDTGYSSALMIDRLAAKDLGLKIDDQSSAPINNSVLTQTAPVSTAVLQGQTPADNITMSLEQAQVTDLSVLSDQIIRQHIVGIIGAGMFSTLALRFDFPKRRLTFFPGGVAVPSSPGTINLPLSESINERAYFATFPGPTESPVSLLVDTGSADTNLPYELRTSLSPVHTSLAYAGMLGSMRLGQFLYLSHLPLRGMPTGDFVVTVTPTNDVPEHWNPALLGLDLLSHLDVTLDIPHMRMLVGPPSVKTPQVYGGWVGVRLAQEAGQFRITQVLPASPAAHAGLKAGDILLVVDGRPVTGFSLSNVRNMVDGLAGTPAVFVTRRAGLVRTLRLRRADKSNDPPCPLNGIFGVQEAANPFIIDAVLPDCPAGRAGLAAGDTITAINGLPTPTLTPEEWETLTLETHLTLTVAREGVVRTVVLNNPPAQTKAKTSHSATSSSKSGVNAMDYLIPQI